MANALAATGGFAMKDAVEIAIVGGVLTVTQSMVIVASETGTTDDLVTLAFDDAFVKAGYQPTVYLKAKSGHTITLKNSGGNIRLKAGSDFSLSVELLKPLLRINSSSNFNDW